MLRTSWSKVTVTISTGRKQRLKRYDRALRCNVPQNKTIHRSRRYIGVDDGGPFVNFCCFTTSRERNARFGERGHGGLPKLVGVAGQPQRVHGDSKSNKK